MGCLDIGCVVNVHCRTGSLENDEEQQAAEAAVHCRTGSLESHDWQKSHS